MDEALYRLHAEREETYWWWVAKNRIILSLLGRYGTSPERSEGAEVARPPASRDQDPALRSGLLRRTALDIGCGAGGVLARLAKTHDAVGIDMSPIARDYCAARGLTALDGSLPNDLPAAVLAQRYDAIVMSEVVEHVPEDRASIHVVANLLKPGGVLLCTVPAHMWLWSSHDDFNFHQRRYTRRQFADLFENIPNVTLERLALSYYQSASLPLVVAGRLVEKARTKLSGKPPAEPGVRPLPGPINLALTKAFEVEKHLLPRTRLPWGTSVISVHRRVR